MSEFVSFILVFLIAWSPAHSAEFYISTQGSDLQSGTREKPFATLDRAVKAARDHFRQHPDEDCTIWIRGGVYSFSRPLVLKPKDVLNRKGKLIFRALPGEKPVFSGGKRVEGWEKMSDSVWRSDWPDGFGKGRVPRKLFIDGERAVRSRFPDNGYLRVLKAGEDQRTHFYFEPGDFPIPQNTDQVELVFLHDWSISRIPIAEIDLAENKLTAIDTIGARSPDFFKIDYWEPHPRYYLENAQEFLSVDREWCSDSGERFIYLKLDLGKDPNTMEVIVPYSEGLFRLEGNQEEYLENLYFEGITFRHSAWTIPEQGYCGVQACHYDPRPQPVHEGWNMIPSAISTTWISHCAFTDCVFENLGGSGILLGAGAMNCSVSSSDFFDISGNGIMIGEGRDRQVNEEAWWKSAPEQVAKGNTVENCRISYVGQQFYGAVGIWCGLTAETMIRANTVHHLPYTGISVGWMWSPVPTPCRDNVIKDNHIHHVMQTLSDGGGIYMLGLQPGSRIENNRIHDVSLNIGRAESNGMFLDEGTTDVVIRNNLVYNIAKSPLRFHRATTNLVEANQLFCGEEAPPIRYNATEEADIRKVKNQIVIAGKEGDETTTLQKAIEAWEASVAK